MYSKQITQTQKTNLALPKGEEEGEFGINRHALPYIYIYKYLLK